MTLCLFGTDQPWRVVVDDQPIVSGVHPLHLYHGYLGARALLDHGTSCCYDPGFQAGYPKTPIFDSGSRPAELFLLLGGSTFQAAAYKIGLAACCLFVPLFFWASARCLGLSPVASCLAAGLGLSVWWGGPSHSALLQGDLDLLLAGLAVVAQFGLLARFDRQPGLRIWLALLACTWFSWFAHPLFSALTLPLFLVYYLSVGDRHRWFWHLSLLAVFAGSLAANAYWLRDAIKCWWIHNPLQPSELLLSHRTFGTVWRAPLWGDASDRLLAICLIVAAVVGVALLNCRRERPAARLLGLGSGALMLLAIAGITSDAASRLGASRLLVPALFLTALPASYALAATGRLLLLGIFRHPLVLLLFALLSVGSAMYFQEELTDWAGNYPAVTGFTVGLDPQRQALVERLTDRTTPEARVLWEDHTGPPHPSYWTALLPMWTGRAFLGGLDPEVEIEHTDLGLTELTLAGRLLADWSDDQLGAYCTRYNVGWVVASSPAVLARMRAWKDAEPSGILDEAGTTWLFTVRREHRSYVLVGQAEWLSADCERIALGNVMPDKGEVVLSLHYQAGLRASPRSVSIERKQDSSDPIPFVRLRLPGPTTCVTLTWDDRPQ
jgi:hypothetical protein